MAWLTTLSDSRRIKREERHEPIKAITASGNMLTEGGIHYTLTTIGDKRFTTWEYTGIDQNSADDLVAYLQTFDETLEAYFQYGEAGGGSIFWRVRVDTYS